MLHLVLRKCSTIKPVQMLTGCNPPLDLLLSGQATSWKGKVYALKSHEGKWWKKNM
jgi:hypothetical protein